MQDSTIFENDEMVPTIEDLFPEPKEQDDFMAWPFIDNLFDFTEVVGKKKN